MPPRRPRPNRPLFPQSNKQIKSPPLPLKHRPRLPVTLLYPYLTRTTLLTALILILLLSSDLSLSNILIPIPLRSLLLTAHHHKTLSCKHPIHLGTTYSGWRVCQPVRWSLQHALVYSVGIARSIEWERHMIQTYATEHHGWDPTPQALHYFHHHPPPHGFTFHRIGLGLTDGNQTIAIHNPQHSQHNSHPSSHPLHHNSAPSLPSSPHRNPSQPHHIHPSAHSLAPKDELVDMPMLTVSSMMRRLGHHWLAILKLDIDGAEFDVIDQWAREGYRVPADQVLVDFHESVFWKRPGYRNLIPNAVMKMEGLGFRLIARTRVEYTFARVDAIRDDDSAFDTDW